MEKIMAAYAYEVLGVNQHHIAALYAVNPGRVAEAIDAVRKAVGLREESLIKLEEARAKLME